MRALGQVPINPRLVLLACSAALLSFHRLNRQFLVEREATHGHFQLEKPQPSPIACIERQVNLLGGQTDGKAGTMAGTFAHITLVDTLCRDDDGLAAMDGLSDDIRRALMQSMNYCELGAISPDHPYLSLVSRDAKAWGDVMHYGRPADMIRRILRVMADQGLLSSPECIAWLFGYTAHVVTDLTIHPVVERIVGEYDSNKTEHRICELNQDVYAFGKWQDPDLTRVACIEKCGVAACSAESGRLNQLVERTWRISLQELRQESVHLPSHAPDPDAWQHSFIELIEVFAKDGGLLPRFLRDFAEREGLMYPESDAIDPKYISGLPTPVGTSEGYESVFVRTQTNVRNAWNQLGLALTSADPKRFTLANANLDTGRDEKNNYICWS